MNECRCTAYAVCGHHLPPRHSGPRWEEWARRIAPLVHDGLIDTRQAGREIPDKAFYIARLLDEHLTR